MDSLNYPQIGLFRHNGFLKLPFVLPPEMVAEVSEAIQAGIRDEVAPVARDRLGRVVRLSAIWNRGDVFRQVITYPALLDCLEGLLGPRIQFITNRHNHATMRLAGEDSHYYHRDVMQWSRTIVTAIVYLEETTVENGCTWVVPGSHLLYHSQEMNMEKDPGFSIYQEQALPVPMPAGRIMVIDSTVLHSAGDNRTPGSRMSMTIGYQSLDELLDTADPRRILVRGEQVYQGNDR
ncbi:MAG: phytanoyl-CoA dioxygenase family protein [Chloroflexi bacterium]|nr:phytanoyl-CoA dioxygenase family protein [Chloroflexota bacterium]